VGAVIVGPNGEVLSMGRNGSPPGKPHCLTEGCLMHRGHCIRCAHAEANAISYLSAESRLRIGGDSDVFVTHAPCPSCCHSLARLGIRHVHYAIPYAIDEEGEEDLYGEKIMSATGIHIHRISPPPGGWEFLTLAYADSGLLSQESGGR
jgi:dCMP deaminase